MSQESNQKRSVPRRLTIETMEDRLLLSISPTGPVNLRDLVEIEPIPPADESSHPVDTLDFNDVAQQFNNMQVTRHIGTLASLPGLPEEAETLKLADPATFLGSFSNAEVPMTTSLASRSSDEWEPIDWNAIRAEDRTAIPMSSTSIIINAPVFPSGGSEEQVEYFYDNAPFGSLRDVIQDHSRNEDEENDLQRNDSIRFSEEFVPLDMTSIGIVPKMSVPLDLAAEGGFIYDSGTGNGLHDNPWLHFLPDGIVGSNQDHTSLVTSDPWYHSWNALAPPPSIYGPGVMDILQTAASMFYQELFAGTDDDHADRVNRQTSTDRYYSSQTTSYSQQNTDSEESGDEENSLFGLSGSGGGTTTKFDADQPGFLEDQADFEIRGFMNTADAELLGDAEIKDGEEGGMIDFSIAIHWSQKPVTATPEGIVQASTQDDDKVTFEGSYGRGQTFELATAAEEEAKPEKNSTIQDISASLMELLDRMPLDIDTKENLDKTDATPSLHEVAISQITAELDHAAILPSDALTWITVALVSHQTVGHPGSRKKKKNSY